MTKRQFSPIFWVGDMQDPNIFGCIIFRESILLDLNFTLYTHTPEYKYRKYPLGSRLTFRENRSPGSDLEPPAVGSIVHDFSIAGAGVPPVKLWFLSQISLRVHGLSFIFAMRRWSCGWQILVHNF